MSRSAWRRHVRLWVPPLVFCLINLGFLAAYRLVLAEEAEIGQGLLDRRATELERLRSLRAEYMDLNSRGATAKEGIVEYRREHLSTEEQKLTEIIAEVKQLAQQAGLEPGSIRYAREKVRQQDVVEHTLVFDVVGTYPQLRRLVNFLELSESFLILEEVSLRIADDTGVQLGIELQIATLFAEQPLPAAPGGEG